MHVSKTAIQLFLTIVWRTVDPSRSAASVLDDIGFSNLESALSGIKDDADRLISGGTQCIKDLAQNSLVQKRFNTAQLGALCANRVSWLKDSKNRFQLLMNDPGKKLTRNQRTWLFQVQDCSDITSCICPGGKCPGIELLDDVLKNADTLTTSVTGDSLKSINKQIAGLKDSLGSILGSDVIGKNNGGNKGTAAQNAANRRNNRKNNRNNKRGKRQVNGGGVPGKVVRKEYRMMTDEERIRLQIAMNKLKADTVDGMSKYDLLVLYHTPTQSPGAHWGAAFLPWHRELVKQLEVSLRTYDPSVAFPYWDSSLDSGLPNPTQSILWTDKFMGDGNGYVTNGPFASWTTQHKVLEQSRIVRYIGQSQFGSLYKPDDFGEIARKRTFADLTSCVDPYFELLHGTVHMWVGGHMADMPISPNDPSFFMHHSFVDYLWQDWRVRNQNAQQREVDYVRDDQACSPYHYANASMIPFPLKNTDGLSSKYTDNFYTYLPRPFCRKDSLMTCDSEYLFCDSRQPRCLSKVVQGGNCTGFEGFDICYQGRCIGGVCVAAPAAHAAPVPVTTPSPPRPTAFARPNSRLREEPPTSTPFPRTTTPFYEYYDQEETTLQPVDSEADLKKVDAKQVRSFSGCPEVAQNSQHSKFIEEQASQSQNGIRTILRPLDKGTESCKCECALLKEGEEDRHETVTKLINFSESKDGRNTSVLTRFPNPTFDPSELKADSDFVWFSVTVLEGQLDDPIKHSMADKAVVVVKGINYQNKDSQAYFPFKTTYPYYPGAVFIRAPNPKKNGGRTEAEVRVYALDGSLCTSYCFKTDHGYVRCSDRVVLDHQRSQSDPMPTAKYPIQIPFLQWKGRNSRKYAYHLYLCSKTNLGVVNSKSSQFSKDAIRRAPAARCRFQRFDDFLLVGFADFWRLNVTLDQCKQYCRNADQFNTRCSSLMYWSEDGAFKSECVITKESRKTQPSLFTYDPKEKVTYLDYICDDNEIFEL